MSHLARSPLPWLLACGAASLAAAPPAAAPAFTIEQVVSAPFPSNLVAAPGAPKVAWVMNARGVRNVWVAEGPEWKGRPLTSFMEDDGEEISGLAFSAGAAEVVFVRGGPPNSRGELPNPLSRAEP